MATVKSEPDFPKIHAFLLRLAHSAGQLILSATPTTNTTSDATLHTKKNSADLVTDTDRAVEEHILKALQAEYPTYAFLGEETTSAAEGEKALGRLGDEPTFVVDPIDGTTNFVHGHPYCCVSLGLAVGGESVVGVVYNPYTGMVWSGWRGGGAWVVRGFAEGKGEVGEWEARKRRLPLRQPEEMVDLSGCLVAVEWGSERTGKDYDVKVGTFRKLCASKEAGGAMVHGIRSLGSAELNLCAVAEGHIDVYWETGCWAWDVCAGWVIVKEAGGKMVGAHPGDWNPKIDQRRYMAVRGGEGQDLIIRQFWDCVDGRVEVGYDQVS